MTLIPRKYSFAFAFVLKLIGSDDLSHSCSHRYFTPNFTFHFRFRNSEGNLFEDHIVSLRFDFCVNGTVANRGLMGHLGHATLTVSFSLSGFPIFLRGPEGFLNDF